MSILLAGGDGVVYCIQRRLTLLPGRGTGRRVFVHVHQAQVFAARPSTKLLPEQFLERVDPRTDRRFVHQ